MLQPLLNQSLLGALMVLLCVALVSDFRSRRIPNRLIAYGLVIGLAGNVWTFGWLGLLFSVGGAVVGLLCLLPFYLSGAMGAGDVKLMAMCGVFLGPLVVTIAAIATLVVGGLVGMAIYLQIYLQNYFAASAVDTEINTLGTESPKSQRAVPKLPSIPYAFVIALGVLVAMMALPEISSYTEGVF